MREPVRQVGERQLAVFGKKGADFPRRIEMPVLAHTGTLSGTTDEVAVPARSVVLRVLSTDCA
jgi:hypothetical protein